MLKSGFKKKSISETIGVSESTLYRELSRNKQKRGKYNAKYAQMLAILFLISCLGLMGFPITYTFIGEDVLYSHIKVNEYYLVFFTASSYIVGGIALVRMYARLFSGNHVKTYHPTPIKTA
tara:strand:- start:2750 stop:3112 length:363 start_codon:yes stop_codon:yes gene_type:complete